LLRGQTKITENSLIREIIIRYDKGVKRRWLVSGVRGLILGDDEEGFHVAQELANCYKSGDRDGGVVSQREERIIMVKEAAHNLLNLDFLELREK